MVEAVNANARRNPDTGEMEYPRCYGAFPGDEPGWENFAPTPFNDVRSLAIDPSNVPLMYLN